MTTTAPPLIDHHLVRARRLELGISERKLTAMMGAGVSQTVVRGIEAGTNHADLTLGDIQRLARLLDLPMQKLLAPSRTPKTEDQQAAPADPLTHAEHLDETVHKLSVILTELHRGIPEQTLAELAELTLDGLEEALGELDARLRAVGLRLSRTRGDVVIQPAGDSVDRDTVREVWRRHLARRGINLGHANVLHRAARGEVSKNLSVDEQLRGASLVNAGILVRTASGGFALSADAAYSMLAH